MKIKGKGIIKVTMWPAAPQMTLAQRIAEKNK